VTAQLTVQCELLGYGGLCVSKLAIKVAGVMMMPLITTRTAAIFLTTSGITWDTW
jgi:hypothetical protein